ncbi:hypothetical protein BDP27DRAFT_1243108 [Rhodocollybia butyracea]|uniref:Uncharacterized protein n=1 Tax=Rhodocollybia butyracea TaxID=206335 RepID=A0A9P5P6T4_9AGAR|nr:hypothetical protein BDP27DRAFT_1243108 [Rhodocollybia butyracea]
MLLAYLVLIIAKNWLNIVQKLYAHRYSSPLYKSTQKEDQASLSFHPSVNPRDITYARPSLSTWATQLVGNQVEKSIQKLVHDPKVPDKYSAQVPVHLAATANERTKAKGVRTVTKEDLLSVHVNLFKDRAPLLWYFTECMAAPKKNGVLIVWKQRNPSAVGFSFKILLWFCLLCST